MKINIGDKITIRNKTNRKVAIQPFNQSFTWVIGANDVLEFPTENAHKALYYLKMGVNRESELDVTIGMKGGELPKMKMGQYLKQVIVDPTVDEATVENMKAYIDVYFNGVWDEEANSIIGDENNVFFLMPQKDNLGTTVAVTLHIGNYAVFAYLKEEGKEIELGGGARVSESGWYTVKEDGSFEKLMAKTTFDLPMHDNTYTYIFTYNHRFDYLNGTVVGVVEVDGLIPFTSGMRVSGFILDTTAATNEEIEAAFNGTQSVGSSDTGIPVIKYVSLAGREQPLLGYGDLMKETPNLWLASDLSSLYVPSDSEVGVYPIGYIWVKNDSAIDSIPLKTGWNKLDSVNESAKNNFENNSEKVYFYTLMEDASGKEIPYKTSTVALGLSTTTKPTNLINLLNGKVMGAILPTEDLPQEGLCPFSVGEATEILGCMVNTKAYTDAELLAIFDSVTEGTELVSFVGDYRYAIVKASTMYYSILTDESDKNQMILIFSQDAGVYSNGFVLQYISSRLYEALKLPKAGWYLVQSDNALEHTDRWILVDGYQELHFPIESDGEIKEPEELVNVKTWGATLQDNTIAKKLNGTLFGAIRVV